MKARLCYCLLFLFGINNGYGLRRNKRYLVFPDGGPARNQFIIGLGIPVDLKDQSVTVGTVIKFQYILPSNSTDYTSRILGYAQTVSRGIDGDHADVERAIEYTHESNTNNTINEAANDEESKADISNTSNQESDATEESDEDNESDEAEDSKENDNRKKRDLISDNNIKLDNNKLTLEEAIQRQEKIDSIYKNKQIKQQDIEEEEEERRKANRWDYYKVIERMVERYGFSGRACLLRTICEAAEVPFHHQSGLLAEIGHVLFTPSTTTDDLTHHTDNEYHAAERLGREVGMDCGSLFPECEISILDTFTQIGFNTLHRFGIY